MFEDQLSENIKQRPQKFTDKKYDNFQQALIPVHESIVEEDLNRSYFIFQSDKQKIINQNWNHWVLVFNQILTKLLIVFHELWRQIMPEYIRGVMQVMHRKYDLSMFEKEDTEKKLFEQYKKNKKRFFIIVLEQKCSQQMIQHAFLQASFLGTEGFGMNLMEFVRSTFCLQWKIKQLTKFQHYMILFMRFNIFGSMIYFGNLTKEMVEEIEQDEIKNFKEELSSNINEYENIEQRFVGSAVQKQDKLLLE